jgi:acyl dehydratase
MVRKMAEQIHWDDVTEGMEIPALVKNPTTQQLVKYAGASGDYYQIHYDKDFAKNNGLEDVILHGALKNAFLGHLMTDWMGPEGTLKKLACQYRGMDVPGNPITAKGVVTRKYQEGASYRVDCEIWLENQQGEKTTPGSATVELPRN